ncbi:MAG: DUF2142 domain-containing protein [bacterium]
MVIPVFNAPDEPFHFEYIQFLAKHKTLPNQAVEEKSIHSEGFNPPLYYLINTVFLRLLSPKKAASDIQIHNFQDILNFGRSPYKIFRSDIYPPLNPDYMKWGKGKDKNMFLTTREDRFPFSGSIRVIHLLRIISLIFGALTVFFIFKTALILFPENKNIALLAASLCALNPQFNFLSGSLNNDNLVILCATISIWFLTRLIVTENDNQKKIVASLGIFLGICLITKLNISGFVIVAILGIIYSSLVNKPKKLQNLSVNLLLFLGLLVIIAGWYFIRNASIYGLEDPMGWGLQAIQNPALVMRPELRAMFFKKLFFQRLYTSFWGLFDWLTIPLTNWMYWIYGIISIMGILGLVIIFVEKSYPKRTKICLLLFLLAILISFASLVALNLKFVSAQARLIFPVMAGICIFMALGIHTAFKYLSRLAKIKTDIFIYAFIVFLIGLNLFALFGIIYPVYR